MKLVTLGTGTPRPEPRRHSTCNLVMIGDEPLLFDVGRGAVLQLVSAGVPWSAIRTLFVTHHHFDHIGDLGDLMITSWLNGRRDVLRVYGPPGTREIVNIYRHQVYGRDLRFREEEFSAHGRPDMAQFAAVEALDVEGGAVAEGSSWVVRAWQVEHGHSQLDQSLREQWVCLGYRIEAEGKVLAISGDGVPCEGLRALAKDADLLLQCCWLPARELTDEYLRAVADHTLACSDVVGKVATEVGAKRLVLTHTRSVTQASIDAILEDVRRDFTGPVAMAEDMNAYEI